MSPLPIRRITRIALTVPDIEASGRFFGEALGFAEVTRRRRSDAVLAEAVGVPGATADVLVMRLGAQEIELTAFRPAGRPYPAERSAADPWFQHFAIVVSDMAAAYATLGSRAGWSAISTDGPQLLPPRTGGIVAFKFRDPDGHPLELSWFPQPVAGAWRSARSATPFLGIDHSALVVADGQASAAFYRGQLSFNQLGDQINTGPEQDKLDGIHGAHVEIVSLATAEPGPHIELLGYQKSRTRAGDPIAINEIGSTRLILEAPPGAPDLFIRDPDGHLLEVRRSAG